MKKSELKKILKPLVQECIRESLLEDGILSGIISEVTRGISKSPAPIARTVTPDPITERMQRNAFSNEQSNKLKEHKSKLMAAIGGNNFNGVNLFEGTTSIAAESSPQEQARTMSGQAPGDPGVDISGLFGSVGKSWTAHMTDVKEGK